jgi:hypothetical protein
MKDIDIKVLSGNGIIFGLSFTNIESTMKLILLCLSITYTIIMIYKLLKNKENENK